MTILMCLYVGLLVSCEAPYQNQNHTPSVRDSQAVFLFNCMIRHLREESGLDETVLIGGLIIVLGEYIYIYMFV